MSEAQIIADEKSIMGSQKKKRRTVQIEAKKLCLFRGANCEKRLWKFFGLSRKKFPAKVASRVGSTQFKLFLSCAIFIE